MTIYLAKIRTALSSKVLDHFRLVAPIYDRVFASLRPERLRSLLELPATGLVLDVGGGTGRVAQVLRGLADEVVVVDESAAMLQQACLKGLPAARAQAESLPFADGAFARILVVDAFHHLQDQQRAAVELLRVLTPSGRLVVEEPNVERASIRLLALAEKLALMRSHFYSPSAMQRIFEAAGGSVCLVRQGTSFWTVVERAAPGQMVDERSI
ncbi:MAG: class I SAM-dependent methyltransferase [Anaerolineae bacterium]|nr:class I SAM-dependent methyltransferase [Anaerolineae bacterium]